MTPTCQARGDASPRIGDRVSRIPLLLVCAVIVFSAACGNKTHIVLDPGYSWNLARLEDSWPGEKPEEYLTREELEVYEEYGRPDAIRLLYDRSRSIVTRTDVDTKYMGANKKTPEDFSQSWIYYVRELEIVFHPSGEYEVLPLSGQLKAIYMYGDPEGIQYNQRTDSVTWMYYSVGKRLTFKDGELIDEQNMPRMGRFRKL